MNSIAAHFKKFDWIMVLAALALAGIGLVSIYSNSLRAGDFSNFNRQAIFLAAGVFLMPAMSFFDWRIFRENSSLILFLYAACIAALAGLFFFGSLVRGVRTWYDLGAVALDPIEFLKPVLLILLAKYFSRRHMAMYQIRHVALTGFYAALPSALIFFQPNLGPCLVIFALWLGMLAMAGIKKTHFLALAVLLAAVFAVGWNFFMYDYQRERVISLFSAQDPLGVSWSQNQARIAVGTGGFWGKGFGQGSQTQYGFLSEPQTDFIFAAVVEEFGFLGGAAVLSLMLLLIWRLARSAIRARDNFSKFFLAGLAMLFFAEAAIHIGVNVGFLPIIGLPLPLMSYGGAHLIATLALLGLAQGIISCRGTMVADAVDPAR
jgi:rod shape determining protein RodA